MHLQSGLWEETHYYPVTHWATSGNQTIQQSLKNSQGGTNRVKTFRLRIHRHRESLLLSFSFAPLWYIFEALRFLHLNVTHQLISSESGHWRKTWHYLSPRLCRLALSNRHHCDESGLLPSLLRAHVPEGGKADKLESWLTGLLAGCLSEQSQSVIVVEPLAPELGAEPQAGALSTRQRAAGLVRQLSEEKVCVYCFPSGCQRHKSRKRGSEQGREYLSGGKAAGESEWVQKESMRDCTDVESHHVKNKQSLVTDSFCCSNNYRNSHSRFTVM